MTLSYARRNCGKHPQNILVFFQDHLFPWCLQEADSSGASWMLRPLANYCCPALTTCLHPLYPLSLVAHSSSQRPLGQQRPHCDGLCRCTYFLMASSLTSHSCLCCLLVGPALHWASTGYVSAYHNISGHITVCCRGVQRLLWAEQGWWVRTVGAHLGSATRDSSLRKLQSEKCFFCLHDSNRLKYL